jgi:hypothetical protein
MKQAKDPEELKALAASMRDIGLSLPVHMNGKPDHHTIELLLAFAGALRKDGLSMMRRALASEPDRKVGYLLGFLRDFALTENDEYIRNAILWNDSGQPWPIGCSKGCSWCCHQNVEVTIPEAILVAVETSMPGDPRAASVELLAEELTGMDDVTRAKTGRPCPFLGPDRACLIYDLRPLPCRTYLAPDPRPCQTAYEALMTGVGDKTTITHGFPQLVGCASRAAIEGILQDLNLQRDPVDLVSTVAAIRRDPTLIDLWAAGANVFAPRPARRVVESR